MDLSSKTLSERTRAKWKRWIAIVIAMAASIYILAAYSSYTRPIWIDEFLQFALGSHRSTSEAWRSISETVVFINHGQTGAHMLLDYWVLHAFGASSVLLRLPSLVAGAFLLFSYVRTGFILGFGPVWTFILLGFFLAQQNLMYFAGEARPYMLLAAAAAGTLAFYIVPRSKRTTWCRLFGAAAIGTGVLFHPYFPVYWLALALFTFFYHGRPSKTKDVMPEFVRHCDPVIAVPSAIGFFVLARLTWMRGSPTFHLDPFQWIRGKGLFTTFINVSHFEFLGTYQPFMAFGFSLMGLGVFIVIAELIRNSLAGRRMLYPLLLIVTALLLSLMVSYLSYRRSYWVLPRQWVGSMGMVCFGFTWLCFEISQYLRSLVKYLDIPFVVILTCMVVNAGREIQDAKRNDICALFSGHGNSQRLGASKSVPLESVPKNNEEWVSAANDNIKAGGPVWPVFRRFYGRNE